MFGLRLSSSRLASGGAGVRLVLGGGRGAGDRVVGRVLHAQRVVDGVELGEEERHDLKEEREEHEGGAVRLDLAGEGQLAAYAHQYGLDLEVEEAAHDQRELGLAALQAQVAQQAQVEYEIVAEQATEDLHLAQQLVAIVTCLVVVLMMMMVVLLVTLLSAVHGGCGRDRVGCGGGRRRVGGGPLSAVFAQLRVELDDLGEAGGQVHEVVVLDEYVLEHVHVVVQIAAVALATATSSSAATTCIAD